LFIFTQTASPFVTPATPELNKDNQITKKGESNDFEICINNQLAVIRPADGL